MAQVPLYSIPSGPYATWSVYATPGSDVPPIPAIAANTLRFEFSDISYSPQTAGAGSPGTWTKRDEYGSSRNVWDWTRSGYNWSNSFYHNSGDFIDPNNEVSIIGCGDLSAVTHMSYMFNQCSSLVNIASLDTSHATNVYEMFTGVGCTQLPDLDFSSVTYADSALARCENLVTAPNITFPTGRAFTANALLSKCFSLVSVPSYDFTYCTSMDEFASQCSNLVNVPAMNTPNVTSMQEAFKNTAITSIPALDYSSVTNTYCMFKGCTRLTAITPINAPNITYAQSMFNGCTNVTSGALDMYNYLLDKVTTSQAHENVFLDCGINSLTGFAELEQIPPEWGGLLPVNNTLRFEFGDTAYDPTVAGIGSSGTWTKCDKYGSSRNVWDWTNNNTDWTRAFGSASDQNAAAFSDIGGNPVVLIKCGDCSAVTNMEGLFQRCYGLSAAHELDTQGCSNVSYIFDRCINCTTLPVLDLSSASTIQATFQYCESVESLPSVIFPTNTSYTVNSLFYGCREARTMASLDLTGCTDIQSMFELCASLGQVTLTGTAQITKMGYAFEGSGITSTPSMVYSSVQDIRRAFMNCASLVTIGTIAAPNLVNVEGAFAGCDNVQSGAFDLYSLWNSYTSITTKFNCFYNCGDATQGGITELNQIPTAWGGLQEVQVPENTIRFHFGDANYNPVSANIATRGSWSRNTDYAENVWDWTSTASKLNMEFQSAFTDVVNNPVIVLGCGTFQYLTQASRLFNEDYGLLAVYSLDMPNNIDFGYAFHNCTGLKSIGKITMTHNLSMYLFAYKCESLLDVPTPETPEVVTVYYAFRHCPSVEYGALHSYNKFMAMATPPSTYGNCFTHCGNNTASGTRDLDQIPAAWGGNKPVLGYTPSEDD